MSRDRDVSDEYQAAIEVRDAVQQLEVWLERIAVALERIAAQQRAGVLASEQYDELRFYEALGE